MQSMKIHTGPLTLFFNQWLQLAFPINGFHFLQMKPSVIIAWTWQNKHHVIIAWLNIGNKCKVSLHKLQILPEPQNLYKDWPKDALFNCICFTSISTRKTVNYLQNRSVFDSFSFVFAAASASGCISISSSPVRHLLPVATCILCLVFPSRPNKSFQNKQSHFTYLFITLEWKENDAQFSVELVASNHIAGKLMKPLIIFYIFYPFILAGNQASASQTWRIWTDRPIIAAHQWLIYRGRPGRAPPSLMEKMVNTWIYHFVCYRKSLCFIILSMRNHPFDDFGK